ncbi:DUF2189 domain-containing protein [Colwellia sp. BRX9-1]|uniref:DUF2189 domain-containing protein n=1 Tax=Colwellia sp. BRX9-1 TaxID=2759830 RepID=UPI0015F5397F|nr:DUF2189 domain-containing protein [Colwellia sp. BRX9-1]MBA6351020.1 DUF2189 domain-containing protein [Colwellia sp. BRX9-1]
MDKATPSIKKWLAFGWSSFIKTKTISIVFSSFFCIIAGLLYWLLLRIGADLVIFPFIAGFFIVAPILIIGFQQVAGLLEKNKIPTFKDLITIKGQKNKGIWFLIFILSLCYFIWITDALVIYGLYFGIEPLPLDHTFITDPALRESLLWFLLYSGLIGWVTAVIGFLLGVFSIPLIIHQQLNFVDAVSISVKTVFKHKKLMFKWALTLVMITSLTLVVALPLLIIVFPVLGYASYAVYADLLINKDNSP